MIEIDFMEFFGYFSVAIIVIVIAVFYKTAHREAHKETLRTDRMNFIVRAPKVYRVIGITCASIFGVILIVSSFTVAEDPIYYLLTSIFLGFFIFGACMAYYTFRWKLVVAGDWLVLTPLFGNERKYSVRDLTHIKTDPTYGVRAYSDNKRLFSVDSISIGCGMLISYLIEKGVKVPDKINLSRY